MPWFVTAEEARFLTHALAQTLEVAPRAKDDPDLLFPGGDEDDETYLVRVPRTEGDALIWEDQLVRVPPPEGEGTAAALDAELLGQLKQLPRRAVEVEVDLLGLPASIGGRGERPSRPFMLMLADARSGMIVGFEMMYPEPSLAEMRAEVPSKLAGWLLQAGVVPQRITARSEQLLDLLEPLAEALGVTLYQADELPSIDAAADSMFGWLTGGGF
jgi:hypothetical protein